MTESHIPGIASVFGIENEQLNEYIYQPRHNFYALQNFSHVLGESDHPVLQYAAAHAALGGSLFRHHARSVNRNPIPMPLRREALTTAELYLDAAQEGLAELSARATDPKVKDSAFCLHAQARQALAYMPLITLAAEWLAGENVTAREEAFRREKAARETIKFCDFVFDLQEQKGRSRDPNGLADPRRMGPLIADTICGLLMQQAAEGYAVTPALLRQGSVRRRTTFANLGFALLNAEPPHRKIFVDTRPERDTRPKPGTVRFSRDELLIDLGRSFQDTADGFLDKTNGEETPEYDLLINHAKRRLAAHEELLRDEAERMRQFRAGQRQALLADQPTDPST